MSNPAIFHYVVDDAKPILAFTFRDKKTKAPIPLSTFDSIRLQIRVSGAIISGPNGLDIIIDDDPGGKGHWEIPQGSLKAGDNEADIVTSLAGETDTFPKRKPIILRTRERR